VTIEKPYIADTEYGKIGFYEVVPVSFDGEFGAYVDYYGDYGNYMIYYGDWDGDIREGRGYWLRSYYVADCRWESDIPNGEAFVRSWGLGAGGADVVNTAFGNVVEGLWNLDVILVDVIDDIEWNLRLDMGKYIPISRYPVYHYGVEYRVVARTGNAPKLVHTEELEMTHGIKGYGFTW
jgi:hypothetical protein